MVFDDVNVLLKAAKLKGASEVRGIEDVPPVIPDAGPENVVVPSARISRRVLQIEPTSMCAFENLRRSAGKRTVYQDFPIGRRVPSSGILLFEKKNEIVEELGRKSLTVFQLRPLSLPALTEPLFR